MNGKIIEWRRELLFYTMIIMMISLFLSRAVLSISMIAFVAFSFFHNDTRSHLRRFFNSPLLWGLSLLFFLPLISGIWSLDKQEWLESIRIKLPLFFLPLAFAGPIDLSRKRWDLLAFILIGLVTAATVWSMILYLSDMKAINEGYLRAKSILTPLGNDHIRFSWLVSTTVLTGTWLWIHMRSKNAFAAWVLPFVIIWLVIYLHVLAARTGILSFYIIVFVTVVWLLFKKAKPLKAAIVLMVLVMLPLVAYWTLPTFYNRVSYILYDMDYFSKAEYLPGANDAVRVISMKAGWMLLNEHPLTGTGFGDIYDQTVNWYGANYPEMLPADKIYPSSEWLMYGAGCGWAGFLIFSAVMLIPFLFRVKDKLAWWLLNITAAFSFLFDIGLEVQFGVFIYTFMVLFFWKWLNPQKM